MASQKLRNNEVKDQKTDKKTTTPSLIREKRQQNGSINSTFPNKLKSLSDDEIKEISKSWTPDEWELYLSSFEVGLTEDLLEDPTEIEDVCKTEGPAAIFGLIKENHPEQKLRLSRAIRKLMRSHLTHREYQVVWNRYWNSMTTVEVASELNISRWNVRRTLLRGEEKMKSAVFSESLKKSNILKELANF